MTYGGGGDICICYRDSFSKLFYINNSDQTKEVMTSKYSEDCKFTAFHLGLMDKGKIILAGEKRRINVKVIKE